jgi:Effector-associated domain 1
MDHNDRKEFEEALAKAFPTRSDLERMLKHQMGEELNKICAENVNLVVALFQLCNWAESSGKLDALLAAACKESPHTPALRAFAERVSLPRDAPLEDQQKKASEEGERVRLRDFSAFLRELEADGRRRHHPSPRCAEAS